MTAGEGATRQGKPVVLIGVDSDVDVAVLRQLSEALPDYDVFVVMGMRGSLIVPPRPS